MTFLTEQFELLAEAQGGVPALRRLILDLAVRGKLVAQDPADEPADLLLERIAAEKARLVAAGELKAGKPLPPITEEEIPYELPSGWVWTQLGDICQIISGYAFDSKSYVPNSGNLLIRIGNVKPNRIHLDVNPIYVPDAVVDTKKEFRILEGDILMTMTGTKGKRDFCYCAKVETSHLSSNSLYLNQRVASIRGIVKRTSTYVNLYLQTESAKDYLLVGATGTANQGNVSIKRIYELPTPLPPLTEQARIVERVESLLAQCDALETAQAARAEKRALFAAAAWSAVGNSDYEAWHSVRDHFPLVTATPADVKLLREAILQLAVRGKLVAQEPADEPADVLLERIAAEKARLVAAGELKAGKPLPPITEEEIPYELPPGWVWTRVGDLLAVNYGIGLPKATRNDGTIPVYGSNGIVGYHSEAVAGAPVIVFGRKGSAGAVQLSKENCWVIDTAYYAEIPTDFSADYLFRVFSILGLAELDKSTAIPSLRRNDLYLQLIPLPPLAEQARIVERVESLLAQCDALEAALAAREQTQAALAGAIAGNGDLTPLPPSP